MRYRTATLFAATVLTAFLGYIMPVRSEDAPLKLQEVQQRYSDTSKAMEEIALQFSSTALDPHNPETVLASGKTRVARKGRKVYSERFRDPPFADKAIEDSAHTGMSYDGTDTRVLAFSNYGLIYPGYQPDQFRNQDDFLGLQGYPIAGYEIHPDGINTPISCNIAELLQSPTVSLTGHGQHLIATCPNQRLTFDRSKGLALVKREIYNVNPDSPLTVNSFSEFFEVVPSVWIARVICIEGYDNGVIARKAFIKLVDEPSLIASDDLFVFNFLPGTQVVDHRIKVKTENIPTTLGKPVVTYQIPTDPANLQRVIADAQQRSQAFQMEEKNGMAWRGWLLCVNIAILVMGAALWGYFRWRR